MRHTFSFLASAVLLAASLVVGTLNVGCGGGASTTAFADGASGQERKTDPSSTDDQEVEVVAADDIEALRAAIGKSVTVEGFVVKASAASSGHQFLNFANDEFYVFCPSNRIRAFGADEPVATYDRKRIRITGEVEEHNGRIQIRLIRPHQISIVHESSASNRGPGDASFAMERVGTDEWHSPAGLIYRGKDPQGLTRLEHVERHFRDIPDRDGPHGVFDADGDEAFAIIDEAWRKIDELGIEPERNGRREAYLVPMGRRIGYLGGAVGGRRRHPAIDSILIVVKENSNEIVTAYPK